MPHVPGAGVSMCSVDGFFKLSGISLRAVDGYGASVEQYPVKFMTNHITRDKF